MEKQVIAFIRASTDRQEVESQTDEVLAMIKNDYPSYKVGKEIVVIGRSGASARKQDDAYKADVEEAKSTILANPSIHTVYIWAVDRLGRNMLTLMILKEFLKEKKVQLIVKNPSLRLLKEDKNVDYTADFTFNTLANVASIEMEQKEARFARGRKRNDERGKYNGGYVAYGYKVENGYIVINEEEAKVVRLIFNELASGKYSCDGLARELQERGIMFKGKKMLFSNVRGILRNKIYCGEQENKDGVVRNIPAIITKELYEKAKCAISANNPSKTNSYTNRNLFGLRLIKCPYCGCHFSVAAKLYQCHNHNRNYYDSRKGFEKCPNGISIGVGNLDRLLWYAAATVHFEYIKQLTSDRDEEIDEKIGVLNQKIQHLQSEIDSIADKRKRINIVFMDSGISEDERDDRLAKLIRDNERYAVQIKEYEDEIGKLLALKDGDIGDEIMFENFHNLMMLDDVELQCKIVRKHIKNIILEKAEYAPYKRVLKITIQFFNHKDEEYLYLAKSLGEFHTMTNGKVDKDREGKLVPIPNLKMMRENLRGEEGVDGFKFAPEIIAVKEAITDEVKEKYSLTEGDVDFIRHTANRFFIGKADAVLQNRLKKLLEKKVIVKTDNTTVPF